mmetsp:Transcript_2099/g.3788  ORF Transcript_2099/g.3788 Transcript_2099/m.3788 type:complete len:339 (-) Transcript_2099:158-1174(-)
MISSRSRNSSSRIGSSMLATVCSSALLLMAFLGNHHVAHACSCPPSTDDPCNDMLYRKLLVRATIQNVERVIDDPSFGNATYYTALVRKVFVKKQINMAEGQTIEIRSGDVCSISFEDGSDMLLDLYPNSNGDYFTTTPCNMNSGIDSNCVLERADYNECFDYSLSLKGPPICPTLPISNDSFCPSVQAPVTCNGGACNYTNPCEAGRFGFDVNDCVAIQEVCPADQPINGQCNTPGLTCDYGEEICCGERHTSLKCECGNDLTFMCFYTEACLSPDCPDIIDDACPSTPDPSVVCNELYEPVTCGTANCPYSNGCKAEAFGWDRDEDCTIVQLVVSL